MYQVHIPTLIHTHLFLTKIYDILLRLVRVGGIEAAGPQDETNRISLFGEDGDVAGPDDGDGEPDEGEDGDPEDDPPHRLHVREKRVRVLQLVDH